MAEVILNCSQCNRSLRVTDELLGRPVKCPACGMVFTVTSPADQPQTMETFPVESQNSERSRRVEPLDPADDEFEDEPIRPRRPRPLDYDRRDPQRAKSWVVPPAICLLITGILGFLVNTGQGIVYIAIPKAFEEMNEKTNKLLGFGGDQMNKEGQLVGGVIISFGTALIALLVIVASIQMLRMRTHGFAIAGSILAMLNIGNCCCIMGIPFGIWSLVVLLRPEVRDSFQ